MGTISARVPDDLEQELETYIDEEKLDRSTAVRKLLLEGLETWRIDRALQQLEDGEVSLTRAAELADVSPWEIARVAADRDLTWVDGAHLESDLEEL